MTPRSSRKVCHLFLVLSSCLFLHADTKKAETSKVVPEASAPPKSYLVEICDVTSAGTAGVKRAGAKTAHVNPADKSLSCSGPVRGPFKIEQVKAESSVPGKPVTKADETCGGLLPKPKEPANSPARALGIDFSRIIPLLGSPYPYSLKAQGNQLLVYSAESKGNIPLLRELLARAADVISRIQFEPSAKPFVVELVIPHYSALGNDLAGKLKMLHVEALNIENVGEGVVRVKGPRECETWDSFLRQVRRLAWQAYPESPVGKLYYLNAADVKTAFADIGGASPAAPKEKDKAAAAGDGTQKDKIPSSADGGKDKADATSAKAADDPSTASAASATKPADAAKSADTANAADAAKASSDEAKQPFGLGTISNDLLIFQESTPGNDAAVMEKKRILAALDLPRPEMIINAWVLQNSTTDPNTFGEVNRYIRRLVQEFNDGLGDAILTGWRYLKNGMRDPKSYFDEPFNRYLSRRVIADPGHDGLALSLPTSRSCQRDDLKDIGACNCDEYCLGYTTLFEPQEPGLSDLILAIIAAKNPVERMEGAVNEIETHKEPDRPFKPTSTAESELADWPQIRAHIDDEHRVLRKTAEELKIPDYSTMADNSLQYDSLPPLFRLLGCEQRDQLGTLLAMKSPLGEPLRNPRFFLECFREVAKTLLKKPEENDTPPSTLGLTRAAIADFLFNYKVSIQYPHEFLPYELTYSADQFNSALAPFVGAFNRDVAAYQGLLRARIQVQIDDLNHKERFKHVFSLDKPTFLSDGIVTVNTISGNEATVNTTTQSYIDVSSAPSLSALVAAITGETADKGNVGTSHLNKPKPGVLSNLSFNEVQVLMGALSAYQSSKAKIGRQLNVDVTPRSLVGASAAEVKVALKADDSASPPIYSSGPGKGSDAEISRFATSEVTTRVRVDSIKLFEVSSFTAVLRNARSRFPLLPPFVELPYIGTLAGIPLPSAKQYHSSTAVLSAIVVPTATDLAYGLPFVEDRVVAEGKEKCHWPKLSGVATSEEGPQCRLHLAVSIDDLGAQPVRGFHNMMVQCLAMDGKSAVPNGLGYTNSQKVCKHLTYSDVLLDWSPFDRP